MRRLLLVMVIALVGHNGPAQKGAAADEIVPDVHPLLHRYRAVSDKSLINDIAQDKLEGAWEGSRVTVNGGRSHVFPVTLTFTGNTVVQESRIDDHKWERKTSRFSQGKKTKRFITFDGHRMELWFSSAGLTLIEAAPPQGDNGPAFEGAIYSLKRRVVREVASDDEQATP
jgi:hypothetical protein